jgi:hypothetical protein
MTADAPQNVRVELRDGRLIPCELVYEGVDGDVHRWVAVTPVPLEDVVGVQADVIPAKTSIAIGVTS